MIGNALLTLVGTSTQTMPMLTGYITDAMEATSKWIEGAARTGTLNTAWNRAVETGKDLVQILGDIGGLAVDTFKALFPSASGMGKGNALAGFAQHVRDVTTSLREGGFLQLVSTVGQVLRQVGDAVRAGMAPALSSLTVTIQSLNPLVSALCWVLVQIAPVLGPMILLFAGWRVVLLGIQAASLLAAAASVAHSVGVMAVNSAFLACPITWIVAGIVAVIAVIALIALKTTWFQTAWSASWGFIKSAAKSMWDWLKTNWPYVLGILTGPIGLAVAWITQHWDTVVGMFRGAKSAIADAASGMWDGLKDGFRSAINWIIDGWNGLRFTVPSIDTGIPGVGRVGGTSVGTPHIPRLAHGGITTGPMLAIVGDNPGGREAIIPLGSSGGIGGGTTIVVNGFVGNARELAQQIEKIMTQQARRGTVAHA